MASVKRRQQRAAKFGNKPTADSFENLNARLGVGKSVDNLISQSTYTLNPLTRRRVELENLYRGSWLIGVAIDCVADDMTKVGVDFSADIDPDDGETLQTAFHTLNLWHDLSDAMRWGRLYGGCIAVYMIDGQDFSQPLRIETVKKGQFKGLMVLDRWQLQPSYAETVTDFGPDFGKPVYYTIVADQSIVAGMRSPLFGKQVHYSRVIRFEGAPLPFYQRMAEMGWGMSLVERIYDRLIAFDSATQGAAQLVYKSHLRTMKVEGLTQILAAGGPAYDALLRNVQEIRKFQSSEGLTLIDAKDEIENYNQAFGGLPEIITQFGMQISGAIQVPLVRLFGQAPGGLNATGESDLRIYYDGINKSQERDLRLPLMNIFKILFLSELGKPMDEGFNFFFSPLWQMSNTEKADYCSKTTEAITKAEGNATISHSVALQELRKASQISGVFSSISDEDIKAAEEEPALEESKQLEFEMQQSNAMLAKKQAQNPMPAKPSGNGKAQ